MLVVLCNEVEHNHNNTKTGEVRNGSNSKKVYRWLRKAKTQAQCHAKVLRNEPGLDQPNII